MPDCDVAIIGAGAVGATLACLLGRAGFRVALVEARLPPRFDADAEVGLRVSAISRGARRVLDAAGAWAAIASTRVSPYSGMHVWEASGEHFAEIRFDAEEFGCAELGYIVENHLTQSSLIDVVQGLDTVELFAPAQVSGLEVGLEHARLMLEDGRRLSAALVVAADGAASHTRTLAGIETRGRDYDQRAVVAHVETQRSHDATARQRFLPDGPLALLPLADGRCSIVWSTTPEHAGRLLEMSEEAFGTVLGEATGHVLGAVRLASARAGFPLRLMHARQYTLPRIALVGDAAHTVHPLAGQGVNLGLMDAAVLAEVLSDGAAERRDIGDPVVLRRYERRRKGENLAALGMLDGLERLFGARDPLVGRMRLLGLGWVDRFAPLKHRLARQAMGIAGDLPRVARNEVKNS